MWFRDTLDIRFFPFWQFTGFLTFGVLEALHPGQVPSLSVGLLLRELDVSFTDLGTYLTIPVRTPQD